MSKETPRNMTTPECEALGISRPTLYRHLNPVRSAGIGPGPAKTWWRTSEVLDLARKLHERREYLKRYSALRSEGFSDFQARRRAKRDDNQ